MTMKFSLRLVWLGGTAILLIISLFLWRNELLSLLSSPSEARVFTGIKSDRVQPDKSPKTIFDSSKRVFKVQNSSTCSYILKSRASTDINTHSVLHKIDEMYNATWKNPHYQNNVVDKLFGNPPYQRAVTVENRMEKLEVVFVPHSHSDPGWLKTIDEYFHDQTRNTLNFMVEKLVKYPNMTFVWAESVFLSMWWKELTDDMKQNVLKLVERNQFQVVVGSWVVPDEATSHYFAIIDQMIEGHQWLEQNLKIKPQTSWSLDPFGYSSTMAYLYRKAGFKQMVILRIHQYLKAYFQNNQKMEFYWRQHWDNTGNTDIFTTLLPFMLYGIKHQCGPDHYECLHFDFRHIAGEYSESMATDINDRNVAQMAKRLLVQVTKKNRMYKHNVVLVPVGDDFRYDRNIEWDQQYRNYQKLFNYMNGKKQWNVHARFGTLKDYYELINREEVKNGKISFPSLQGDFFPYSDKNEDYWTGYFTTRPYDKNLERQLETQLRSAEILNVLAKALSKPKERYMYYKSNIEKLEVARQSLGLFQHHDGITGTARAYVVQDYEERLNQGHLAVKSVIEKATAYLMAQRRDSASFVNLKVNTLKSLHMVKKKKVPTATLR